MKSALRPYCQNTENCVSKRRSHHCKTCKMVVPGAKPKAAEPQPFRSHCKDRDACKAKGPKHCHSCAASKQYSDRPDQAARRIETSRARIVALNADPEFQTKAKAGKSAVLCRLHGVPTTALPFVRAIVAKGFRFGEAAAIVRRDLVKGA